MTSSRFIKIASKTPIFAYLRKSTNKEEQKESLLQQEDGIGRIVRILWLEDSRVMFFGETFSGFENKKRKKFGEMLHEIDKLKQPCVILVRDTSRLSRNPTDSKEIMDRLYGDNKRKVSIEKIIFLDFENIKDWTKESDKESVHKQLSSGYYDSLDTKRKSIQGILLKLEGWVFPYTAPKGLEHVTISNKRILKQNDKMPLITRAFEMKTEGKSHKEISKFLRKYWDIRIGERELTDRLFTNTIYIGEYTEKNTGSQFSGLSFFEWHPPINTALWEKVKRVLGRKTSTYGVGQEGDVLVEKLRTEDGRRMSKYLAKQKYPNYKNTIEDINIAQTQILSFFMDTIRDVLSTLQNQRNQLNMIDVGDMQLPNGYVITKSLTDEEHNEIFTTYYEYFTAAGWDKSLSVDVVMEITKEAKRRDLYGVLNTWIDTKERALFIARYRAIKDFTKTLNERFSDSNTKLLQIKQTSVSNFQKEKENLGVTLKNLAVKFANDKIDEDTYKSVLADTKNSIEAIDRQISEMSQESEMEEYLKKLPNILFETFELASNTINKAKNKVVLDDVAKLLEITTFELTINNKKELKIKLFDVLDKLLSDDISTLEAPSGVEPLSTALQAAV